MHDHFTPEYLRAALGERPFQFFEQVTSTQDIARDWALNDPQLPGGAVVIAEEQIAGRGRQGRVWLSPPDSSIMCSIVLRPHVLPEQLPRLMMVGGIAVAETLDPLIPGRVALKWPNDVLVQGRKISGILAEATWQGDHLGAVIVGIGINVRVDFGDSEIAPYATSLEAETGHAVNRHEILAILLQRVDHWSARVLEAGMVQAWRDRLGTLGKRITVYPKLDGSDSYSGVAEAVEDNGALLVRTASGEMRRVIAADVGLWEE
jgi:BirA family biotin operon repressor/biotin-[acetyl-CoA-carboxylase] ligase